LYCVSELLLEIKKLDYHNFIAYKGVLAALPPPTSNRLGPLNLENLFFAKKIYTRTVYDNIK